MEAVDCDTNTLVVNNIASIAFRLYGPRPEHSVAFASAALQIEATLRDEGHTALYDIGHRGIWIFEIVTKDNEPATSSFPPDQAVSICGQDLVATHEGFLDPVSLQKSRRDVQAPNKSASNSSSVDPSHLDQSQRSTLRTQLRPPMPSSGGPQITAIDSMPENNQTSAEVSREAVYEAFITAVVQIVSAKFCHIRGAVPLNYRTILLPVDASGHDGATVPSFEADTVLGTLRAYLTTAGALVLTLKVSHCQGLSSFGRFSSSGAANLSQPVVAAPFGVTNLNRLSSPGDSGTASLAQTPNLNALSCRGDLHLDESPWKQACVKILEKRGVLASILKDCTWINLQIAKKFQEGKWDGKQQNAPGTVTTVPWPRPLCFGIKPVETSTTFSVDSTILSGHEENHDPLRGAEGWFASAGDRDERLQKRRADRALHMHRESHGADPRTQRHHATSSLALRQPVSAIPTTIYPTPPDALQNPNGVTPSLDGTVSSPGNPPSAAAVVDVDAAVPGAGRFDDALNYEESEETKQERGDGNLLEDADNVFEDMSGDMFGDNDVTEADFNFFDEQPHSATEQLQVDGIGIVDPEDAADTDCQTDHLPDDADLMPPPQLQSCADDGVFAKPDLKHTSCYRNGQTTMRGNNRPEDASVKRPSSPFDPDIVFKRVRATLMDPVQAATPRNSETKRKNKTFDKIDFDSRLPLTRKKYQRGGVFEFEGTVDIGYCSSDTGVIPNAGYWRKSWQKNGRAKDPSVPLALLLRKFTEADVSTAQPTPVRLDIPMSDEDSVMESDQDDSSSLTDEPGSPVTSVLRPATLDDDVTSRVTSLREIEPFEEPDQLFTLELPWLFKPEVPEVCLSKLFLDPEPFKCDGSLSNEDLVQVAQIVAEQAATGTLDICGSSRRHSTSTLQSHHHVLASETGNAMHTLERVALSLFPGTLPTRLKELLDIQDVAIAGQPTRPPGRLQPRQIPGRESSAEQLRPSSLYPIPGPRLEVRRSDTKLSVLPSAIQFWESLGLAPSSGGKDVTAVGLYPSWNGMAENVDCFLGRLKSVYESLKLGLFEKLPLAGEVTDGILSYEVDRISTSPDATMTGHGSALFDALETLRGALSNSSATDTNFVVYFIYTPSKPTTIVEACTAFQRLFESYQDVLTTKKEAPRNELVLQLVSVESFSSSTEVVITPPAELAKLCMETYDRCTLFGGPMPAPAIRLEQSMPRIIDFKLVSNPSASLIHENSCMHVAYAQSVDGRWVAAAWTDDRGNQQGTAAYCLARRGKSSGTSMNDVAHEIWESTLQLISIWKVHWRVIITKCAAMEQQEIDFWLDLARTEIKANVTVILMTVDTNPSLQLIPPAVRISKSVAASLFSTSVTTPQESVASAEQNVTPATPAREGNAAAATPAAENSAEADSNAVLVDITDQSWAAILGHHLSNTSSILEVQAALASGYLIKRTGPKVDDTPALMEVNLIHTEAQTRAHEPLLREMLSYFRGLATLARARGVTSWETDVRPWHVAAAEKALRALYLLM